MSWLREWLGLGALAVAEELAPKEERGAPIDRIVLGNAAKRLMDDPVLKLAFARVERDLTGMWRQSAAGDRDGREVAYHQMAALAHVKAALTAFLGDAKVIEAERKRQEADEQMRERLRERGERVA